MKLRPSLLQPSNIFSRDFAFFVAKKWGQKNGAWPHFLIIVVVFLVGVFLVGA
jgi:hypothetical protein